MTGAAAIHGDGGRACAYGRDGDAGSIGTGKRDNSGVAAHPLRAHAVKITRCCGNVDAPAVSGQNIDAVCIKRDILHLRDGSRFRRCLNDLRPRRRRDL